MWALIKRGFNGVYHHWTAKHCHRYIDEFTFRSNEGNRRTDTIDRIRARCERRIGKAADLRIFDEGRKGDRHILIHRWMH